MSSIRRFALLLFAVASMTAWGAVIVTFEDLNVPVGSQLNPPEGIGVISFGFSYTPGPNNDSGINDLHISNQESFGPWNGTTNGRAHDDVVLAMVGGGGFTLNGFDFAGWPGGEIGFTVRGYYVGGGSILQVFTPDGINDGPGGQPDFESFVMAGNWSNLSSVVWEHYGQGTVQGLFSLDNIVINNGEIPEPSTFALLGIGLAALAVARRRAS